MANLPANPQNVDQKAKSADQNALNSYDLSTYNLRFYVSQTSDGITAPGPGTGTTLAETAKTRCYIDDLNIQTVHSATVNQGTSAVTQIRFTIIEPLGCSFLDEIYNAAKGIGIDNFTKCPYFLDISFKGRDPETSAPKSIGKVFTYGIIITAMQAEIKESGTTYQFTAVKSGDYANTNEYGILQESISIPISPSGSTSVNAQDIMDSIAKTLTDRAKKSNTVSIENKQGDNATAGTATTNNVYQIIFDTKGDQGVPGFTLDELSVLESDFLKNQDSMNMSYLTFDPKATTIQINKGTSIIKIIETLMNYTKYLKDSLGGNSKTQDKAGQDVYYVQCKCLTDTGKYDTSRNDYVRTLQYTVKKRRDASITTVVNPSTPPSPDSRTQNLFDGGVVPKVYNYLFTGKNIDVLNVDIKLNFAWYMPWATIYGNANPSNSTTGILTNDNDLNDFDHITDLDYLHPKPAQPDKASFADDSKPGCGPFPTTIVPTCMADRNAPRIIGNNSRTRAVNFVAAIFEQGKSGGNADLMNIEVTIRGDPFWLDPFNAGSDALYTNPKQLYFQLIVTLPSEPQDNGLINTQQNGMITALYKVFIVDHTFKDGKFIQILHGIRDVQI